jgi:ABC-type Na+ efflux pump permease subunit
MCLLAESLGGPVLPLEIKRSASCKFYRGVMFSYCAWLLIQALALFSTIPSAFRESTLLRQQFFGDYLAMLLRFQLLFVMAVTPAIAASSLGQEKERGTMLMLFCTQLSSRQILVGTLLGRLLLVMPVILSAFPVSVFSTALSEQGLSLPLLALIQLATVAFALAAAGMLFGIWVRKTADAVMASCFFLGLVYLFMRSYVPLFDPVENLGNLVRGGQRLAFVAHLAIWVLFGLICLHLGSARLRPVCVAQHDWKPPRRLWAFRPAVGNNPIRWRECYVIGLAPIPVLRILPRWLALVAVFIFSAGFNGMLANEFSSELLVELSNLEFAKAYAQLKSKHEEIVSALPLMGLVFILLASLLLGVRCGLSVSEEKRRNTWDDLLLTAQSFREITTAKMWGILQGIAFYVVAYALAMFLLASLAGMQAILQAAFWTILPCAVVCVAALGGIDMVKVPPEMDETRESGAFWYEKRERRRRSAGL